MAEIKDIFSDFQTTRKEILDSFESLETEKQDLEEMHRILGEVLLDTERKFRGKTVYLTDLMKNEAENSERRLEKKCNALIQEFDKRIETFSRLSEHQKKTAEALRRGLMDLEKILLNRLKKDVTVWFENEKNRLLRKFPANDSKTKGIPDSGTSQPELDFRKELETITQGQKLLVSNFTTQLDVFDRRMERLESRLETALKQLEEKGQLEDKPDRPELPSTITENAGPKKHFFSYIKHFFS